VKYFAYEFPTGPQFLRTAKLVKRRAIVSATVRLFGDLLKEEVSFLSGVRDEVQGLHEKLQEIQCFLKDADMKQNKSETVRNWLRSIKNLAYETENVLEIICYQS
jgi:hypothetical protein